MDETFEDGEKLYRSVYPPEFKSLYWEPDGSVSSAAFYDRRGLSVTRGNFRSNDDVITYMKDNFKGRVISVLAGDCRNADAYIKYCPSRNNKYHSEIHGSKTEIVLSKRQRRILARVAVVECK